MLTEPLTIFLLWTLMAGQPVDVDSFIVKAQCDQVVEERRTLLKDAIHQTKRPELEKIEFAGCQPVPVQVPRGI